MKVLLDNNIPIAIRKLLGKHHVFTSAYMGWTHLQNGDLLAAAEAGGFDVMVTADQNLSYQQSLAKRKIALVVLGTPRWSILSKHVPQIVAAVDAAKSKPYEFLDFP